MKITAGKIVLAVVVLVGAGIYFGLPRLGEYMIQRVRERSYGPVVQEVVETGREDKKVFDGPSSDLKQTVIVPSLQSKLDKGRNVIWCASFDMAWNELKTLYPPSFLQVKGAEETVALLNNSQLTLGDLPDQSYYAAAGFIQNGIVKKIQDEMKERFPGESVPSFDDIITPSTESIAYSYLQASLSFTLPFFDNDVPLVFKTSEGRETSVASFGIRDKDGSKFFRLRKQVKVMFVKRDRGDASKAALMEFALDLCRDSKPNQIVLACVEPKETLAGTVEYVEAQMPDEPDGKGDIGPNDSILIPNLFWKIEHSFHELEGDWIQKAKETIEFRLNRRGAELKAHSKISVKASPRDFVFDRPFLIYMKKRGAEHPYFVAWIGNEELLTPWAGSGK
jgi:hypothetical protein